MRTNIKNIIFRSSHEDDSVSAVVYYPDAQPVRAVVFISHGMIEHIGRYHEFMLFLAHNGIAAFGHDHLGHGKTASSAEKLGFFSEKDGYQYLIRDLHQMNRIALDMFPEQKCFLMGHSMGSLIARLYCVKYPESIGGVIFMGTPGPQSLTPIAMTMAQRYMRKEGALFRPPLLQKMTIDDFNKRFDPVRTAKDWLTRDEEMVDRNLADPLCNFSFTAAGFSDLYAMMEIANSSKWFKEYPKALPTNIVSGDCDPVGNFGRGVMQVYNRLLSSGVEDLRFELYKGARHELLNEVNREEIYQDLLDWLISKI